MAGESMASKNIFEMPQFDGSSFKLLWKDTDISPALWQPMTATTIVFNREDYPLLIVVSKKTYYVGAEPMDSGESVSILVNDTLIGSPQTIDGGCQMAQASIIADTEQGREGFFRTATVVEEGLTISDAQWKYGTYNGDVDINCFVIPTQIYGIR